MAFGALTIQAGVQPLVNQRVIDVCLDAKCSATVRRRYVYYLPPNFIASRKTPVFLILHGTGIDAASTIRLYGLIEKANETGFLLVAPEASPCPEGVSKGTPYWNSGGEKTCPKSRTNDVGFLRAVLEDLSKGLKFTPDRNRIFIAGHSGGANMAYRMACEASDIVAAVGTVAGVYGPRACPMREPVSVIAFNATSDLAVAYSTPPTVTNCLMNQRASPELCFRSNSVPQTIDLFMSANQCTREVRIQEFAEPVASGRLSPPKQTAMTYTRCRLNAQVQLNRIDSGPESSNPLYHLYWPKSFTDQMWRFFLDHSR